MNKQTLLLQIVLAVAGCCLGAYVGQELIGDSALGWAATGAITAGFCAPLFKTLIAWRQRRG